MWLVCKTSQQSKLSIPLKFWLLGRTVAGHCGSIHHNTMQQWCTNPTGTTSRTDTTDTSIALLFRTALQREQDSFLRLNSTDLL